MRRCASGWGSIESFRMGCLVNWLSVSLPGPLAAYMRPYVAKLANKLLKADRDRDKADRVVVHYVDWQSDK